MSFYGEINKVIDLQYLVSKGFSFPLLSKVYHITDKLQAKVHTFLFFFKIKIKVLQFGTS